MYRGDGLLAISTTTDRTPYESLLLRETERKPPFHSFYEYISSRSTRNTSNEESLTSVDKVM